MLKLILSEMDALRSYVSKEWYTLLESLVEDHGWVNIDRYRLWQEPGSLKEKLLRRLERIPDVILFWEGYDFIAPHRRALEELDCRKCVFADDLHWHSDGERHRKRIAYDLCNVILTAYANVFADFYPDVARRREIVWVPHSASPLFVLELNENAENAIFLSGAIDHYYPLRQQMKTLCDRAAYPIVEHPHPGYFTGYDYENDSRIGAGYARSIHRYRVGFTDASIFHYLVAKHFEIPATGALLLAESAVNDGLRELGFIEDVHYVAVSQENLEEKVRYVLDETNHPALDRIRRQGQALVLDRHRTSARARLVDEICALG